MICEDKTTFVEKQLDKVINQYRESPKLLHMIRVNLEQLWDIINATCNLPSFFDLDTAVGDQLTIIGKWMGFPRCHCVCDVQPAFGFACDLPTIDGRVILGFCEGALWLDCVADGISEICITDDEMYRKFLKVRAFQIEKQYAESSLEEALQVFFGEQARVLDSGHGEVVVAPFRALSPFEEGLKQLYGRVLPIAPGVNLRWHLGTFKIFGFGEGWGGFCEEWEPDGLALETENGITLETENGVEIITGPLYRDADWLCREDFKPYSC